MAQKTVVLFGGSFNPFHPGHLTTASYLHEKIRPDQVWMLFSENPFKNPENYVGIDHRIAMGELMARHHPDVPLVMSDFERNLTSHQTCDVLREIRAAYPDHRFIWAMGIDSLIHFHTWDNAEEIITHVPIVVLNRPSYSETGLISPTALDYAHLRRTTIEDIRNAQGGGWIFLEDSPLIDMSSSALMKDLQAGRTDFTGPFKDVADYIYRHGLYNTGPGRLPVIQPLPAPRLPGP